MMPNPFTPPPEGAPEAVKSAYRFWQQKFDREQIARSQRDSALVRGVSHSVEMEAQRALDFAENETNMALQLYYDSLRDAAIIERSA